MRYIRCMAYIQICTIKYKMSRAIILFFFLISIPVLIFGQSYETFEIQADKVDSNSNHEIQIFYQIFNLLENKGKGMITLQRDEAYMVNNFVMFSEDGLLMKDLDFHSVESCKEEILKDYPKSELKKTEKAWMFVSLESQVNKGELISILEFLRRHEIDYVFGKRV